MKKLSFIFLMVFTTVCFSKTTDSTINSLKSSNSLAGSLLGLSPSEIKSISEKPKFLSELSQLSGKTENFTVIPKSFAFDIAPVKVFSKTSKAKALEELYISIGYKNNEAVDLTTSLPKNSQLGIGIGINFIQKKEKLKINNKALIKNSSRKLTNYWTEISTKNEEDLSFDTFKINNKAIGNSERANEKIEKEYDKIKNRLLFLKKMTGNISLGNIYNQATKTLDQFGIWGSLSFVLDKTEKDNKEVLFGQKETQNNLLFLVRYLNNDRDSSQFLKTLEYNFATDLGVKFTYHSQDNRRYYVEIEALGRSIQNEKSEIKNSSKWKLKYDINLGYELAKNFVLTASFGKDFGSNVINQKSGNLFALLNIAGALGANKPTN